jgi:hypothetical protein
MTARQAVAEAIRLGMTAQLTGAGSEVLWLALADDAIAAIEAALLGDKAVEAAYLGLYQQRTIRRETIKAALTAAIESVKHG